MVDQNQPPSNMAEASSELHDQTENDAKQKQDFLNDEGEGAGDDEPAPTASPTVELTAKEESDDTITIFTKLTNVPTGSCILTIRNNSQQTTQTAPVIYQPEYSTCAGFSISKSSLGPGKWQINLAVETADTKYTQSVDVEVK